MKLVTGGAGFIGSHLVDALVQAGDETVVLDSFATGRRAFLSDAQESGRVRILRGDCGSAADLKRALRDVDEVWHMAADPDVRAGLRRPWSNFRDGAVLTFRVLDEARKADVGRFVFASSSTVYGEASVRPTPEDYGPALPISPYGASKLAAEGLVSAYVGTFGLRAWIFRFGNVVGRRLTHGVIHDFTKRLREDPRTLKILGDGHQTKAYLSVSDCVAGMRLGVERSPKPLSVYNLASGTTTNVETIARIVTEEMGLRGTRFEYAGGDRGWKGDVPVMDLDIGKIRALGWSPQHSSEEAVRLAARAVAEEARSRRR